MIGSKRALLVKNGKRKPNITANLRAIPTMHTLRYGCTYIPYTFSTICLHVKSYRSTVAMCCFRQPVGRQQLEQFKTEILVVPHVYIYAVQGEANEIMSAKRKHQRC